MSILSVPHHLKIDFFKKRWLGASLFFIVFGAVLLGFFSIGVKKGIDFQGGVSVELKSSSVGLDTLRKKLGEVVEGSFSLQEFGGKKNILLRCEIQKDDLLKKIRSQCGRDVDVLRIETIGPKIGKELLRNSIYGTVFALIAMLIYVGFRFQWVFGLSAILSLMFDCCGILLFYLVSRVDFNEGAIVALLITAAYSINDTVIVFDRVRENQKIASGLSIKELINRSVNETLPRTLLTSASTLTALVVLYILGGPVIQEFVLPIMIGFTVGTYSSIILAAPILGIFLERRG